MKYAAKDEMATVGMRMMISNNFAPKTRLRMASRLLIMEVIQTYTPLIDKPRFIKSDKLQIVTIFWRIWWFLQSRIWLFWQKSIYQM